jgi:hypothetical protein
MFKLLLIILLFVLTLPFVSGCTHSKPPITTDANTSGPTSPNVSMPSPTSTTVLAQPNPLADGIAKSDLIVSGNITNLKYEVETVTQADNLTGKRVYTIYSLSVEKVIKGDPAIKEVLIKVEGGKTNEVVMQNPSVPNLSITDRLLVGLYRKNDYYYFTGFTTFWIERSKLPVFSLIMPDKTRISNLQEMLGYILMIMRDNNIPITLPEEDRPPFPVPNPVSTPMK